MKPKYAPATPFHAELERRVDAYFVERNLARNDAGPMYLKLAVLVGWLAGSYVLLLLASAWWQAVPLAISLGLAAAGIGFNVQHDANHAAFSRHGAVNRLLGLSLDVLGGSSYVWKWKHNVIHHSYPNIDGADDDIAVQPMARLAPSQKWYRVHRLQFLYMWLLYGFLATKWHALDDFKQIAVGRITGHKFPRPRGWDAVVFVGGKVLFFAFAFGLPLVFHRWWTVLGCYAIASFTLGLTMSVVFQLAHCVEQAEFPLPAKGTGRVGYDWAAHQTATAVDFARSSRLTCWYVGGLNFQIEHHLFPRICHAHYPAMSRIVEEVCARHGVPYRANHSVWAAVMSHLRWLRRMGVEPSPA